MRALALLALLGLASAPRVAAQPADGASIFPPSSLLVSADTSTAALRVEQIGLGLAHVELRALSGWRRYRPQLNAFLSLSTRGIAFPSISTQGYDPAYAAIARWPGDTWGLTVSWSAETLLDRRPVERARAAVVLAEARIDLVHARRAEADARDRTQALARSEREADERRRNALARRRAIHAAALLRTEAGFLSRRLAAQQDLLRLAEMTYAQGEMDYEALARQRLAVLAAEHAVATNAARLDAAMDGHPPDAPVAMANEDPFIPDAP